MDAVVSLSPPARICVSSLALASQHGDHLSGLSGLVVVRKYPCFVQRGSSHTPKISLFTNTFNEYIVLLIFSDCEFERLTRLLLLYIHPEADAKSE